MCIRDREPSPAAGAPMARIDAILKLVKEQGASDLHMTTGAPPIIRIHGEITPIPYDELTREFNEMLLFEMMDDDVRARYDKVKDVDFSYEVPGVVRVRCNVYEQTRGVAGAFRILPNAIRSLEELGLPAYVTLRAALREDPDVILVGEMRDPETMQLAITAAATVQLVFGTLHTMSATQTVDRIVDSFEGEKQAQVRLMLSESLKGVLAQRLLRRKDGTGRALALEILMAGGAVSSLIRERKTYQ